jgi:hypothetical protein
MRNLLLAVCLFLSSPALGETATFECHYTTYSDDSGNHEVTNDFILTFLIDKDIDKGYLIGNNGSNEVIVIYGPLGRISFIEVTDTTNVMTTVITRAGSSVHSRNTVILEELVASQYYGECVLK